MNCNIFHTVCNHAFVAFSDLSELLWPKISIGCPKYTAHTHTNLNTNTDKPTHLKRQILGKHYT